MRIALGRSFAFVAAAALLGCSSAEPGGPTVPAAASPVVASDSGADATAPSCPTAAAPTSIARVDAPAIAETSGLVESKQNPGVFWVHNDSGDAARAFAFDARGALVTTLAFDAAAPVDIEDMAIEDAPDGSSWLYFADIGDNAKVRESVVIHRVREPRVGEPDITVLSETMTVKYIDRAHDAETLLFDPVTRDLVIVTKVAFGSAAVHRVGPFVAGTTATTTRIGGIPVALATAGDISRDGQLVAVRSYATTASVWRRAPGEDLAALFARVACKVPIASEPQGESFAFLADGSGYATLSEGAGQPLFVSRFP